MKPETLQKLEALKQTNPDIAALFEELIKEKEVAEGKAKLQQQIALDAVTSLELAKAKQSASSVEERNLARQIAAKQLAEARNEVVSVADELEKQMAMKKVKVTTKEARDQDVVDGKVVDGLAISLNGVRWFLPQDTEIEVPEIVAMWLKDRADDMKRDVLRQGLLQIKDGHWAEYSELNMGWRK